MDIALPGRVPRGSPIRNVYRCGRITRRGRAQIAPFCAVEALARLEPAVVAVGHLGPEHLVVACNRHSPSPPRPLGRPRWFAHAVQAPGVVVAVCSWGAIWGWTASPAWARVRRFRCLRTAAAGGQASARPPAGGEYGYGVVAVAGDADGLGLPVGRGAERFAVGMHRCHHGVRRFADHPCLAGAVSQMDGVCPGSSDGSGMAGSGRDSVLASPGRRVQHRLRTWPMIAVVRAVRGWR